MSAPHAQQFDKYNDSGAYHYESTIGARSVGRFDIRVAARYETAADLLGVGPGNRVLDAGGGEGVAGLVCAKRGASVVNLEMDPTACELSRGLARKENFSADRFSVVKGSVYEMPFEDASFDAVVSLEVIEHLDQVPLYLHEMARVLKRGGRFVISTPHKRKDGKLQDPYHVVEFDNETLREAVAVVFPNAQVLSGWKYSTQARYEANRPAAFFAKIRRNLIRFQAMRGQNIFVDPSPYDSQCPQLFCVGTK